MPHVTSENLETKLKKSTTDLLELERALMSGNTDARVLRDFRDAVDYVRKAAWAVQEWQARQAKSHDTSTVLPLLMIERIRRATQLCNTISTDMQSNLAAADSQGVDDLSQAIQTLGSLLALRQGTLRS